ncbi:TTF-type domain-containing protein [Citrus sinensis]|uniref:TTF-type domain-containing protein n=1 Tax=Citrus sinensis TaxID=2711 RepID=A0ACB8JLY3_CITSI|nr:TTF-type domain-containing protein [Citrus sinensis]
MSHKSKPRKTLISFFAKVDGGQSSNETSSPCNIDASKCDSGLRISINTYPIDKREYVRMAYINMGSFQPELQKYPSTKYGKQNRRFQFSWFSKFLWLEYSISKDKAFCFPCFLFYDTSTKYDAFIIDGCQNWNNLKDPSRHIDKRMNAQSSHQVLENRLRLKTSISVNSLNRENFIELIKLLATINEEINKVVLENAPKNAQYIAPKIQKELLNILANKVQHKIRERIEDAKFCILFYEASTLKNEICNVLARYNLLIENLRGQGYDGASNMAGDDCPYTYYVHCFAHRLQLVLVAVSKEVHEVWLFFSKLSSIANFVNASFKRYAELKAAKDKEILELIASEELETGTSANQVRTLQRAGDTRWSSHFTSVSRLIEMFTKGAYREMTSFEFVFILHLFDKVLGISNFFCRALQTKSLDILNALNYVTSTKRLLQEFRDNGCDDFIISMALFCRKHDITVSDMSVCYMEGTRCSCRQKDYVIVEHHYHFDIFNAVIDFQLTEINSRLPEETMELLTLSSTLDPIDGFKLFDTDRICCLAEKFYPHDFTTNEILALRRELEHYKFDVLSHPLFQKVTSLSELCRRLIETKKSQHYFLIDRLIHLELILPVSTAATERAFSAMSLIKTSLCSKIENEFLSDCMIVYTEREIADTIDLDSIIDKFHSLKS